MKSAHRDSLMKKSKDYYNTFTWKFLSGGDGIPSSSRISIGDEDPVTGKILSDDDQLADYCRDYNREIEKSLAYRFPCSAARDAERARRRKVRQELSDQFLSEYGYRPSPETLRYLFEQKEPVQELLSTECLSWNENFQEDGSGSFSDSRPVSYAEAGFSDDVGDDIQLLREYVSTLTPLQYDVYSAMLLKYEGIGLWITDRELAEKWGVHPTTILYERKKIIAGIRIFISSSAPWPKTERPPLSPRRPLQAWYAGITNLF